MKKSSKLEEKCFILLKQITNVEPTREYRFDPVRRWRFDFAFIEWKIAVEVEGGIWLPRSGHTHPIAYSKDCEKYNMATKLGWKVYRLTAAMITEEYITDLLIV